MKRMIMALAVTVNLCPLLAFSQTVINEIMYAPSDATNEWFEIYNAGEDIDLLNWKWKDATATLRNISSVTLILKSDSFAVVCQDSVKFRNQFQKFRGMIIQTSWSALNNSGDNLILISSEGARVDSTSYSSSWGGNAGGYSLERKDPEASSLSAGNWGSSLDPGKATPGRHNSIRILEYDLSLGSISIDPLHPVAGGLVTIKLICRNTGITTAQGAVLRLYDDSDLDSIAESGELINETNLAPIQPGDSVLSEKIVEGLQPGLKRYIVVVEFAPDLDSSDNVVHKDVYIAEPGQAGSVVINEIMFDPLTGKAEWIELYNPSGASFNIMNWMLEDNTASHILSDSAFTISSGGYLVIASDSSLTQQFEYLSSPDSHAGVIVINSLSLNNSGETLIVLDSLETNIDIMTYDPSMHNPELDDTKGISLERINHTTGSNVKANWSSCADASGGTPGRKNSIAASNSDFISQISINPNPFSPDNDGHEDVAIINCIFGFSRGTIRANIYNARGNMVRTLSNGETSGNSRTFIFDGFSDAREKLGAGIYIVLIEAIDNIKGEPVIIRAPLVIAGRL